VVVEAYLRRARARIGAVPQRWIDQSRSAPAAPRNVRALRSPARRSDTRRRALDSPRSSWDGVRLGPSRTR